MPALRHPLILIPLIIAAIFAGGFLLGHLFDHGVHP